MAPESLINNTYSFKSDVWALGIVLYEMLIGHTPFISPSEDGLRNMLREY
jgi:serine/threonine protein kinase